MDDAGLWITARMPRQDGEIDIVAEAQAVLTGQRIDTERRGNDLYLAALGLMLAPRGLEIVTTDAGHIRTVSIVRAVHPKAFSDGLFEYQHGVGADLREALHFGLNQWAQLDVPVLCDALREKPEQCSMMEMTFPAEDGRPERPRRAVLGPTGHMVRLPPPDGEEEHPFCPCCLTTNCMEAFMPLFKADETLGLRLFAMRNEDGETSADCRINGEDFEEGKAALRAYAQTWPQRGFELRKQYVLFQSPGGAIGDVP
jgi:hypothetical protein